MGRTMVPAGKYTTRVNMSTRQWTSGEGKDIILCDISSNFPILFSKEDNPPEEMYSLSIAIYPHQPVYLDTADLSFILLHCGDTIGVFIASTPLLFRVTPHNLTPLCLEYHSSFYELIFLDQAIQVVTEQP